MKCKICNTELLKNRKYKFKEFCNHSCKAKYQFLDINQHKIRSIKASLQMKREYESGKRNKFEITKKANEKVRLIGQPKLKNKPSWNKGLTKYDHKTIMDSSIYMKNGGAIKALKSVKKISKPQLELYNILKQQYPTLILKYPINNFEIDMALPEYKIGIEFDGIFWHDLNNKFNIKRKDDLISREQKRNEFFKNNNWHIIRFNDYSLKLVKQLII